MPVPYREACAEDYNRFLSTFGAHLADRLASVYDRLRASLPDGVNTYDTEFVSLFGQLAPDLGDLISKNGPRQGLAALAATMGLRLGARSIGIDACNWCRTPPFPVEVPDAPMSVFEATVLYNAMLMRGDPSGKKKAQKALKKAAVAEVRGMPSVRAADNAIVGLFRVLRFFS